MITLIISNVPAINNAVVKMAIIWNELRTGIGITVLDVTSDDEGILDNSGVFGIVLNLNEKVHRKAGTMSVFCKIQVDSQGICLPRKTDECECKFMRTFLQKSK